jgi:hypothetical protein
LSFVFAMFDRSFRLVAARLIPGAVRPKQRHARAVFPGAAVIFAATIFAGCGSSPAAKPQRVAGDGYRFSAPSGWRVTRNRLTVAAAHDTELVEVSTFPLLHRYRPSLFDAVARELQTRMQGLADQTGGKVEDGGVVTAAGVRSHVYRLRLGDHVDEYTFVLVGRREYQLLCRTAKAGAKPCRELQSSFALAS